MNISLRIICLTNEIPEIKRRLSQQNVLKWEKISDDSIAPYWKAPKCSCIELNRAIHFTDVQQMKKELACISGESYVNESVQGDSIDLACYTPLPEILSGSGKVFATCHIQSGF